MSAAPYPAELRVMPRRRPWRPWLLAMAVVASLLAVWNWAPRPDLAAAPHRPAAAVAHPAAHPALAKPSPLAVSIGKTAYACTVTPPKARAKAKR